MGTCFSSEDDTNATQTTVDGQANDAAAMIAGDGLSSKVELKIQCSKLKNMDIGSLSDPFVVVHLVDPQTGRAKVELGRTEIVANDLNPHFVKSILMLYSFEEVQKLAFRVYDMDTDFKNNSTDNVDVGKQDFLGEATCCLADIVGGRGGQKTIQLTSDQKGSCGSITIIAEELAGQNDLVQLVLCASKLPRMDTFGKSDPFLKIYKEKANTRTACFKTEVVKQNLSPQWNPINIGIQQLCNGDENRTLIVECYDWNKRGQPDYIGEAKTTLQKLLQMTGRNGILQLTNKKQALAGVVQVVSAGVTPRYSFLDYITGGCELNFGIAIDFTASNGHPNDPASLHYRDPTGRPNDYIQTIRSIGQVLEFYDHDKMFPVYGFGGRVNQGPADHCFPLNGNSAQPEVAGMQGVEQAYVGALQAYQLAGPTIFTQVIGESAAKCQGLCTQENQGYFILLIITDGIINDMDNTISSIINASNLPMSILIVGVGDADFEAMDILDGDDVRLANSSGVAVRDIVQFVPFREFQKKEAAAHRGGHGAVRGMVDHSLSQSIAEALLEEVPAQLLSFMEQQGIQPQKGQRTSESVHVSVPSSQDF